MTRHIALTLADFLYTDVVRPQTSYPLLPGMWCAEKFDYNKNRPCLRVRCYPQNNRAETNYTTVYIYPGFNGKLIAHCSYHHRATPSQSQRARRWVNKVLLPYLSQPGVISTVGDRARFLPLEKQNA